jgi:hypothetical protein
MAAVALPAAALLLAGVALGVRALRSRIDLRDRWAELPSARRARTAPPPGPATRAASGRSWPWLLGLGPHLQLAFAQDRGLSLAVEALAWVGLPLGSAVAWHLVPGERVRFFAAVGCAVTWFGAVTLGAVVHVWPRDAAVRVWLRSLPRRPGAIAAGLLAPAALRAGALALPAIVGGLAIAPPSLRPALVALGVASPALGPILAAALEARCFALERARFAAGLAETGAIVLPMAWLLHVAAALPPAPPVGPGSAPFTLGLLLASWGLAGLWAVLLRHCIVRGLA